MSLCDRYEPGCDISPNIGSEMERVNFVKSIAALFVRTHTLISTRPC